MGKRKYTDQEVRLILDRRDHGVPYAEIAAEFRADTGGDVTAEAIRHVVRAWNFPAQTRHSPRPVARPQPRRPQVLQPTRSGDNTRILVISDMHVPYQHPDTVEFLSAINDKYKPTRIVCVGDEVDHHAMSFHDSDPDLLSAGDELQAAIKILQPLYELFPEMDLIDSNHGSMAWRRAKTHGVPRKYIRSYNDVLDAPTGWQWHMDLLIDIPGGNQCYFHHGLSSNVMKVVAQRGMCVVQGHYHSSCSIGYLGNPNHLLWGMQTGCSIDGESLAFAYDRTNLGRPIISHGIIIDGQPKLLPIVLGKNGRWAGFVP